MEKKTLLEKYLEFCDSQMSFRTLWYLIPLMSLSAAVMPIGIALMSYFDWYLAFVALSTLLFFSNILVNIIDRNTRVTISLYIVTILIHIIAPLFSLIFKYVL